MSNEQKLQQEIENMQAQIQHLQSLIYLRVWMLSQLQLINQGNNAQNEE